MLNNQKYYSYYKKLPIHNLLAEEIIIGHILSSASITDKIIYSINIYCFTLKKYQLLFQYGTENNKRFHRHNLVKLIEKLWEKKILQEIGGIDYIIRCIQKTQTITNLGYKNEYPYLKYFIRTLHYYYIKRLFIQYSNHLIQLNYLHNYKINKIYEEANSFLNKIGRIYKNYNTLAINTQIKTYIYNTNQSKNIRIETLSGFEDLDKITRGFNEGDLVIIAGRPSMGKTSFALNLLCYLAYHLCLPVYLFSLEMSKNEILDKLIALISNINIHTIQKKFFTNNQWHSIQQTCNKLAQTPLCINDNGYSSIDYIKQQCEEHRLYNQIIIIDYLQLIQVEKEDIENRSQEIGKITRTLKLLAQQISSTIFVLSQLNRNIENRSNKRPLLSDLRESGCVDSHHLPKIKKQSKKHYIETIHCFKSFYLLNRINNLQLYENKKQHIFLLIDRTQNLIHLTHNHRLFKHNTWTKKDQFKNSRFHSIKYKNSLNSLFHIELCIPSSITYIKKNYVYDLSLKIYHNFLIEEHLVHNSIEQDADLILMLYKDQENIKNQIIDIIIAKNRHGPIGNFQLLFQAEIGKFNHLQQDEIANELQISLN